METRHHSSQRELELEDELAARRARSTAELREAESMAQEVIRRRDLELEKLTGEIQSALIRARREIDNTVSDDRIRMTLVESALPAIAQAFSQQFGEVRFTQIGGGDGNDPTAMIARSIAQVLEVAKSLGLRLGSATGDDN
jgi:flotillin